MSLLDLMDGSVTPWLEALLQYMRLPLRQVKDELSEQAIGPGEPKRKGLSAFAFFLVHTLEVSQSGIVGCC